MATLALGLGTSTAFAVTCPNATLREEAHSTALPDCRAYELVTPVFKGGFSFAYQGFYGGGSHVLGVSTGLAHGADSSSVCGVENPYDLARSSSGWVTTPFFDGASGQLAQTNCNFLLGEDGSSLIEARPVSHSIWENDLYLHRPDGSYAAVGPVLPSSAFPPEPTGPNTQVNSANEPSFLGATPDLTHVLFSSRPVLDHPAAGFGSALWPGDTTNRTGTTGGLTSLYEYAGTANTVPSLVGVDNKGALISDCGTSPGGTDKGGTAFGSRFNVISSSGQTVYFTSAGHDTPVGCPSTVTAPDATELFARLNNGQPQSPIDAEGRCAVPADGCTVAISEPNALSPAPANEGCKTTECHENTLPANAAADFRGANFAGAASDGSRALFLSTQQLTDTATQDPNPQDGAIGGETLGCRAELHGEHGCNLYAYEFSPSAGPKLIDLSGGDNTPGGPAVQGVAALSEDASRVYFVARGVLAPNSGAAIDPLTGLPQHATAGAENLYLSAPDAINPAVPKTVFIATLTEADSLQWNSTGQIHAREERVDKKTGMPFSIPTSGIMNVTGDGRFLLFTSSARLTPGDTSTARQVFRYDALTGQLIRVSIGNEGFNSNGNTNIGESEIERPIGNAHTPTIDSHPAISEDGQTVAFTSSDALVAGALDNRCNEEMGHCVEGREGRYDLNVYEYRDGHVYLISDGRALHSGNGAVSPSGNDIFFSTNDALVSQDGDTLPDVYDARVNGGFSAPAPVLACGEEACQPPTAPTFPAGSPASATLSGAGNLTPSLAPAALRHALLGRAQRLIRALRACHAKHNRHARNSCEARARKRYGPAKKTRGAR